MNMKVKVCGKDFLIVKHTEYREYIETCPVDSWGELGKHYFYESMVSFHDYTAHVIDGMLNGGIY
ncbi:hypothetical protein [Halobacillus sp. BBL2006]|uniref:hypothetical protein n=1 Tax=Halobacillus sp. BBL2006 TaxID=1543706 RepID=UPI0012E06FE0|nr:hypothetical protein [Halobacillus sp. BBL2006]